MNVKTYSEGCSCGGTATKHHVTRENGWIIPILKCQRCGDQFEAHESVWIPIKKRISRAPKAKWYTIKGRGKDGRIHWFHIEESTIKRAKAKAKATTSKDIRLYLSTCKLANPNFIRNLRALAAKKKKAMESGFLSNP